MIPRVLEPSRGLGRHRTYSTSKGTLRDTFDPRHNHVTLMRLGLATLVAVVHALAVGYGWQPVIGVTQVGDLAVDAFFVLSGFLITASYLRLRSPARYLWHRFLRIMPGFWVCLILTAGVVAPLLAVLDGRSPWSVFTAPTDSAPDYVIANAALLMRQFGIDGLPAGVPEPGVLDGALWTLFYEALCYVGVIGLACVGGLRRRPFLTLLALTGVWLLVVAETVGIVGTGSERMPRFTLLFLIGAAAWLYADRIPVRGWLAATALVVLAAAVTVDPYHAAGAFPLAYLCFWVAVQAPPAKPLRQDVSYGMYIYHWPIVQILVVLGLTDLGGPLFVATGVALSVIVAAASWHWVERPALGWKDAAWVERIPVPGSRRSARHAAPIITERRVAEPAGYRRAS